MKWSEIYLKTLRENPAGAGIPSHILLLRSGFISMSSQGIYLYNTLFLRSIHKFSTLIRKEVEKQGAREIAMPMVQPKQIWEQSKRWDQFEGLLLKMKGRTGAELCLGPTHEELIINFVKSGLKSWRDMPFNLYQIQTKYRDEIRPRFGLMRAREFLMKDAYSFDISPSASLQAYDKMFQAYKSIFSQLGVEYTVVKADSGEIGGSHSEEFHILAEKGEDELLIAEDLSANIEICPRQEPPLDENKNGSLKEMEEFATPGVKSISDLAQFLSLKESELVKILFFISPNEKQGEKQDLSQLKTEGEDKGKNKVEEKISREDQVFAVLCLGDDEVNPLKIKQELNLKDIPALADEQTVYKITGAGFGSCGPCRLTKEIPIYLDYFLKSKRNFITGANKNGFHLKNVNPDRDFKVQAYGDFCFAREGDLSPQGKPYKKYRGIEVGHLFYLGDEYSKKMNLSFLDKEGKKKFVEMGCYGLGVTRALQAIVEQSHDDKGMIWPLTAAPFAVHICLIDPESPEVLKAQEELIDLLKTASLDYFIDDRKERPGSKFKDADLIGLPLRINIGVRDLKNQQVELYIRKTGEKEKLSLAELKNKLPSVSEKL